MKSKVDSESNIDKVLEINQYSGRGKGLRRWLIMVFLLVAVIIVTIIIWKSTAKSNTAQYITEEVRQGSLTVIVTATGTLEPTNKVDVGSELSGIIKSVEVDYNDRVKVNQVLARLDTSKLEAQIAQAKATLESAKAKVLQAQATVKETQSKLDQLKRVWEISNKKVPSQSELDAAEAAFTRAKADEASASAAVSQAQANLKTYETDLSKSIIRSPVNGIVLVRNVEPGQTVAASFQAPVLFTLAEDLTKMELHVNVDEADIGKVKEGQKAMFHVSAYPNRIFEAKIIQARFGSSTTSGVVTYETVLQVDNSDMLLRPGMTATADITVNQIENVTLVPNTALLFTMPVKKEQTSSGGSLISQLLPHPPRSSSKKPEDPRANKKEQRVYALRDGKPLAITIKTGETDGSMTEVISGNIKPGMPVVVDMVVK